MKWLARRYAQYQEGPPDLDAMFKEWFSKFSGKQKHRTSEPSGSGWGAGFLLIVFAIMWALMGIYIVQPAEEAAILRFGKYVRTEGPGIHWMPMFVEKRYKRDVAQVVVMNMDEVMLTESENMVAVAFAVQYRIGNLEAFLFNVRSPVDSLKQILDSAVRQVIGHSRLDEILTTGRDRITEEVRKEIEVLIARYGAGIIVTDVAMQSARAPDPVRDAFDDVIKAREDRVRTENQAQAYANKRLPIAEGHAKRLLQEAEADKQRFILQATGGIAEFTRILPEYQKAPGVTSDRMYFDTMQRVLEQSKVVLIEQEEGSSNVIYLPLQDMIKAQPITGAQSTPVYRPAQTSVSSQSSRPASNQVSRGARRDSFTRYIGAQS